MERDLRGVVAVITGSGRRRGIGYGIARTLARLGASTVVTDICRRSRPDPEFEAQAWEELVSVAREFEEFGGKHRAIKADVTNPDEVNALLDQAEVGLGVVNTVVNNAGICVVKPLLDTSLGEWEASLKVNATGTFLFSVLAAKRMVAQGIKGNIINISSISGKEGWPDFGAYTASKFAVLGFSQTLARELAPHGIRVNAVCPGLIATDMNDVNLELLARLRHTTPEEIDRAQLSRVPLGRYGSPEDVANAVAFLISEEAAYMTGQAINVTGGLMVCR